MFLWCVRGGWRDIYSERGLLPISSSRSQGVPTLAPPCKLFGDASDRLRVPRSTAILCTLSKSDRVVRPKWPDAPSSSCLQIKMWQLAKYTGSLGTNQKSMSYVIWYIYKIEICNYAIPFIFYTFLHYRIYLEFWLIIGCCIVFVCMVLFDRFFCVILFLK